jgi:hypothetical protein
MSLADTIPVASRPLLKDIPIDRAVEVGQHLKARFDAWDQTPKGRNDPSLCKGLFRLPSGALFWQSKMAIDADGSPTASVLASSSGSNPHTSLEFANPRKAINPEVVPYFVLPQGEFDDAFHIALGTLGVVIYKGNITGAIYADAGPAQKIGEASIRVHELIVSPKSPWKGNPADKIIRDVSIDKGVVYIVFPGLQFDITPYKPGTLAKQRDMAAAIHTAAMAAFEQLKAAPAPQQLGAAPVVLPAAERAAVERFACDGAGDDVVAVMHAQALVKPTVDQVETTTHKSSRNGTKIDHIVLHYTGSRNVDGVVDHFKNGTPTVSAHYIIGQDGSLCHIVPDAEKAWHAGVVDEPGAPANMNARSIGIEHAAKGNDKITPAQSAKSIALIKWLMSTYAIPLQNIIPHRCVHETDCCGDLFKDFGGGFGLACAAQRTGVRGWLASNGIGAGPPPPPQLHAAMMAVPVPPPAAATPLPAGWVMVIQRLREESRAGIGFKRTVGTYQVYHDGVPQPGLAGMTAERGGPGDNSAHGDDDDVCIEAGNYRLQTQVGSHYRTVGYHTDNVTIPRPGVELVDTGARTEILIHPCHDHNGFVSSVGCINLSGPLANGNSKVSYSDSIARVIALIGDLKAFNGGTLPSGEQVLANCHVVVRKAAVAQAGLKPIIAAFDTGALHAPAPYAIDIFAFSSTEWNQLAAELAIAPTPPFTGEKKEQKFAEAVINKLLAKYGGPRLMIGFDANTIEQRDPQVDPDIDLNDPESVAAFDRTPVFAAQFALVRPGHGKPDKAALSIYVEGPGGATGADWSADEALRTIRAAKSVVAAAPADPDVQKLGTALAGVDLKAWQRRAYKKPNTFKAEINDPNGTFQSVILPAWRNGSAGKSGPWWHATRAQLQHYRASGFAAAEIDNLAGLFSSDETTDAAAFVAFLKRDYLPHSEMLPKLLLKNVNLAALAKIKSEFTPDERAVFADFHIYECEQSDTGVQGDIADATTAIGRRAVFSFDTHHYHCKGSFAGNDPLLDKPVGPAHAMAFAAARPVPARDTAATTTFDPVTAAHFGTFVAAAYDMYRADPSSVTPPVPDDFPAGHKLVAWVRMRDFLFGSTEPLFYGFIARETANPRHFVLAIRGTTTMTEWFDNLASLGRIPFKSLDCGTVGAGFARIYDTMQIVDADGGGPSPFAAARSMHAPQSFSAQVGQLVDRLRTGGSVPGASYLPAAGGPTEITVVGHSLGSALATLFVMEHARTETSGHRLGLCAFASPRVGDDMFASSFDGLGVPSWNIINKPDLIPKVPYEFAGFRHVGKEITIDSGDGWPSTAHALRTYLHELDATVPKFAALARPAAMRAWAVDRAGVHGDDDMFDDALRPRMAAGATSSALAGRILASGRIELATTHSSGVTDRATPRFNIEMTAAGERAQRSSYGTAPGGTVMLDRRLLEGLLALAGSYRFAVAELCGGSHNPNSRHYAGVAADINVINGRRVGSGHPDLDAFKALCRALGATEVLGPGQAGHDTHVHAAWPRP